MSCSERPTSAYGEGGTSRAAMDAALKAIVVPHLRSMGFKGSMPHFHRARGEAVDLCSFQFLSSGGSFAVELGRIASEGFDFHGKRITPAKARTSYLGARDRHRLGGPLPPAESRDSWYVFWDEDAEAVACEVCEDLDREAVWAALDELETRA